MDGDGHRFAPRRVREVVPGKVYVLSGIEFTEFSFVVSEDRRQLIAIDAGTRPEAAREASETLRREVPGLPPLTTLFVTHAHWDHVGGARYFRSLEPAVTFYGRGNYADERARQADGPQNMLPRFFGTAFRMEDVMAYRPDRTIDRPTRLDIGGTAIELLPASGGETEDALLVFLPAERVLFAGDVIMPYLGAPFLEEGSVEGLLATIDLVARQHPRLVLHGHEPLTRVFTPEVMMRLRAPLAWLRASVLEAVRRGDERGLIQQRNLIPPGMLDEPSAVQLAYLVLRENVINRLYDRHVGYWQPDLQGMDALAARDYGAVFTRYLGVDDRALAQAARHMIGDGRYELAARVLQWVSTVRALDDEEAKLRRLAYVKLVEKYQEFNPFKLIVYAGEAGLALPPVPLPAAPRGPRQP